MEWIAGFNSNTFRQATHHIIFTLQCVFDHPAKVVLLSNVHWQVWLALVLRGVAEQLNVMRPEEDGALVGGELHALCELQRKA